MPRISHVFFDLHGTLIASRRMHEDYKQRQSEILAGRYGKTPADWLAVIQQVAADWDSYHADLNFSGDDGMRDYYEALFRTTRALFKGVRVPEPPHAELTRLAREIPAHAARTIDAFYPDAQPTLHLLHATGLQLGIAAHSLQSHISAILEGGAVEHLFAAPLIGADTVNQFDKDVGFYRKVTTLARIAPEQGLVVDDDPQAIRGAQQANMTAILLQRPDNRYHDTENIATICIETLAALPSIIAAL